MLGNGGEATTDAAPDEATTVADADAATTNGARAISAAPTT